MGPQSNLGKKLRNVEMISLQEQIHINSTRVIRPVKRNKLSFSSAEINKPLPVLAYGVSLVRFKFRSQL